MLDIISDKCAADNMADNKNIRRPPCGFGLKSRSLELGVRNSPVRVVVGPFRLGRQLDMWGEGQLAALGLEPG